MLRLGVQDMPDRASGAGSNVLASEADSVGANWSAAWSGAATLVEVGNGHRLRLGVDDRSTSSRQWLTARRARPARTRTAGSNSGAGRVVRQVHGAGSERRAQARQPKQQAVGLLAPGVLQHDALDGLICGLRPARLVTSAVWARAAAGRLAPERVSSSGSVTNARDMRRRVPRRSSTSGPENVAASCIDKRPGRVLAPTSVELPRNAAAAQQPCRASASIGLLGLGARRGAVVAEQLSAGSQVEPRSSSNSNYLPRGRVRPANSRPAVALADTPTRTR